MTNPKPIQSLLTGKYSLAVETNRAKNWYGSEKALSIQIVDRVKLLLTDRYIPYKLAVIHVFSPYLERVVSICCHFSEVALTSKQDKIIREIGQILLDWLGGLLKSLSSQHWRIGLEIMLEYDDDNVQ